MNSIATFDLEQIVDLADELREAPGLNVLSLSGAGGGTRAHGVLLVRASDIALFSSQSVPSIQVLGAPGDMVQFLDHAGHAPANQTWQRYPRDPDLPGFTLYSSEHGGRLVQLLVEDGVKVLDAGGARV